MGSQTPGTRLLAKQRIAAVRSGSYTGWLACMLLAPFVLLLLQSSQPAPPPPLKPAAKDAISDPVATPDGVGNGHTAGSTAATIAPAATAAAAAATTAAAPAAVAAEPQPLLDHQTDRAMAVLNRERARKAGAHSNSFRVYRPTPGAVRPGGDVEEAGTLRRAVEAAAAGGEVMLLCIGGSGSMRAGMNLVMNFRTMGLYHMLILAPDRGVCDGLWSALPSLACVWWPARFTADRPASLYNTMFSRTALAFFEARKILMERLVVTYRLNVLHLDADTVWFANPYPLFKTLYKDYTLIIQTDNPFVNAGIMYVQNVAPGDATAWVLEELNRRIDRFTYRPESVRELPSSGWSTAPHFANADEQANLNDIVTTVLNGKPTYAAGVEFYEARFKRDKGDATARAKMADGGWVRQQQNGDVAPARRHLVSLAPAKEYEALVHLCKMSLWERVSAVPLAVPGNASAPRGAMLLAPEWLFSHFPYGAFFPSFRQCHADSWGWKKARGGPSALEQRLCMPTFRVPVVMVHMAGLRNGQWGRRGVMRALGVWHDAADAVATEDWVSPRTERLLALSSADAPASFRSMAEFDRFAARLLLLGLLLRRRVVMPPMPCRTAWAQSSMEPRHLRGLEVGCGPDKQCVWLPMPHFKEAWCNGVDFLYDIDYRELLAREPAVATDAATLEADELEISAKADGEPLVVRRRAPGRAGTPREPLPSTRVLLLRTTSGGGVPLSWLPLDGFERKRWGADYQRRVADALRAEAPTGLELSRSQLGIVKDCLQSLATSKD
jgi:hypothetical protein